MNNTLENVRSRFSQIEAELPGTSSSWLKELRRQSLSDAVAIGFPTERDELWKYTNINPALSKHFVSADQNTNKKTTNDFDHYRYDDLQAIELFFVDGIYSADQSSQTPLPEGLQVENLNAYLNNPPQEQVDFGQAKKNIFAALNTSFMSSGAVITVADNVVVKQPVHLIFLSTGNDQPTETHPRIEIRSGANAQLKVIETYAGQDKAKNLTNAVTRIFAGENSQLEHYRLQEESVESYHIANVIIEQAQDSRVESHSISLGASIARVDINVNLAGTGATVNLNGLYLTESKQHADHHLHIDHISPHTESHQFYKGVLAEASRAVFNGKVIVHEDAQKVNAVQSNKNLLLSENAEIDTKPELEIYADDVKCAHGATIGQLNQEELFYLQSRGISEEKAKSLLTFAFVDEVISKMSLLPVQQRLEEKVLGHIAGSELIRDLV